MGTSVKICNPFGWKHGFWYHASFLSVSHIFVDFSHSLTFSLPSPIHCPYSTCLWSPFLSSSPMPWSLSFCLPPSLHCSDVLNLLRGLWKLSWSTTHRMKAQLVQRTANKAKYVLFNSWKYVCTVTQIDFSRSVVDQRKSCSCSKYHSHSGCIWFF